MNPETDIVCLQIVKGIPKAPGDTESAEEDLVTMDLLDVNGLSVQPDGWTLAFPGIKRNGTWADAQISDGRTLISASKENVIETMQMGIGNADLRQRYQIMAKLQRFADDARDFWTSGHQIQPVYLKFKATGSRVYQYALIYDMSLAQSGDPYEIAEPWEVTLVIEREVAWRMVVPPGGNPLEYWYWTQGKERGVDYTISDLKLGNNTDHFAYDTIENRMEWNGADYTQFVSRPWVDIDASKIPGDAEALVYIAFQVGSQLHSQIYLARDTHVRTRYDRIQDKTWYHHNVLLAADATKTGTGSYAIDTCGVYSQNQLVNKYIVTDTVPAGPDADFDAGVVGILEWLSSAATAPPFIMNMFQGEWALFLRAQQTNGAEGDTEVRARVQLGDYTVGAQQVILPAATLPYRVSADCDGQFDIVYLGRISVPSVDAPLSSPNGYGFQIDRDDAWRIYIDARNLTAAARTVEFLDLWFMPISEGFCAADATDTIQKGVSSGGDAGALIFDNTGYTTHGRPDDICIRADTTGLFTGGGDINPIQLLGNIPTLAPGKDNRLIFLDRYYDNATSKFFSRATGSVSSTGGVIRINIVPRCYGIAEL